ncbi:PRC-barrel domain-containing protein [Paenibacillus sp. MBLB4367]|uniref:PRC-barrel domain-containing protein n=1 Tax=Paenibacillus sp. MBLB4367 TaxID=3384767 RepID=UPI0039080132
MGRGEGQLRKAYDILGLPVIEVNHGKRLGTAKDFWLDAEMHAQGVVLETKNWFTAARYIDWDDVVSFGEDAITVQGDWVLRDWEEAPDHICLVNGKRKLKGTPVLTVNGLQLGMVEDVYFSENMGKPIIGYELSDGFLTDVTEGRKWLPAPEKSTFGDDVLLVPVQAGQELNEINTE